MKREKPIQPLIRKRLARIERKCDVILALLRPRPGEKELDRTIDLMHEQAKRMKEQTEREARRFREYFSSRQERP